MSPKSEVQQPKPDGPERETVLQVRALSVFAGKRQLLRTVSFSIPARQVFGVIGPSGAGKSTLLRCLNRLIDLDSSLRLEGDIHLHGRSIFAPYVDVDALRARMGAAARARVLSGYTIGHVTSDVRTSYARLLGSP